MSRHSLLSLAICTVSLLFSRNAVSVPARRLGNGDIASRCYLVPLGCGILFVAESEIGWFQLEALLVLMDRSDSSSKDIVPS